MINHFWRARGNNGEAIKERDVERKQRDSSKKQISKRFNRRLFQGLKNFKIQ